MIADKDWKAKLKLLDDLAMRYEVAVKPLYEEDYLKEFQDFYEIKNRRAKLVPAEEGFEETLKNVSGEDSCEAVAEKTKSLFGLPVRVTVFENNVKLREELEGPDGLSPFFFVFDLMFCEYGEYTLCFISGSNNQSDRSGADRLPVVSAG